jgi:hypothetical protein
MSCTGRVDHAHRVAPVSIGLAQHALTAPRGGTALVVCKLNAFHAQLENTRTREEKTRAGSVLVVASDPARQAQAQAAARFVQQADTTAAPGRPATIARVVRPLLRAPSHQATARHRHRHRAPATARVVAASASRSQARSMVQMIATSAAAEDTAATL